MDSDTVKRATARNEAHIPFNHPRHVLALFENHTGCCADRRRRKVDVHVRLCYRNQGWRQGLFGQTFYNSINARPPSEKYWVWQRVEDLADGDEVETVNLWVTGHLLSGLVTFADYDRATNDNVVIPFASGCQSIWTIPFKQQLEDCPEAVVGGMDPTMRWCLTPDIVSFAVPATRLVEMAENVRGSFLEEDRGISSERTRRSLLLHIGLCVR